MAALVVGACHRATEKLEAGARMSQVAHSGKSGFPLSDISSTLMK